MDQETQTPVEPFPDAASCLEAWFDLLGPVFGSLSVEYPSGISPINDRAEELSLVVDRTRATREAGIRVPVLDVLREVGLDLLDHLLVLALLRETLDSRQSGGLRLRQLCEGTGSSEWKDQAEVRVRLETAGALRGLGLVQSDDDSVEAERLYRLTPAWKSALLEGRTEPAEDAFDVSETVTGRLQEALFRAVDLLAWITTIPWVRTSGWGDAFADRPGWDHLGPRRRSLALNAASYLRPAGPAQGDPLGLLLRSAGAVSPAAAALLLILLSRRPEEGPLSWAVLEAAVYGMEGAEAGLDGLLGPGSVLVRAGLVELRSEQADGALAAFAATPRARSLSVPMGVPLFQPGKDDLARESGGGADVDVTKPRLGLTEIVLTKPVRARIEEALALPRALRAGAADWGLDQSLLGSPGVVMLFYGPPGTGKTLCAEAIAGELGKSLWRLRVDQLVSRWAGETEKNLAEVFRRARGAGDVVLLDEADSLLTARDGGSQRWEVSMTNLLLQEVERFPGVLVLTTNRPDCLDPALERRVLAKVEFEMPGEDERLDLWKRHLPPGAPFAADVDLAALAKSYPLSGSGIRTAALFAVGRAANRPEGQRLLTGADLEAAAAAQLARRSKGAPVVGFTPIEERRGRFALAAEIRRDVSAPAALTRDSQREGRP